MSRDDGFPIADVDTGLFDDPKVRTLYRQVVDPAATAACLALYVATILASWRHGERVTAYAAAPIWMRVEPATVAALHRAGLLDARGKVPVRSWEGWYGPAFARREARRESGRQGGAAAALKRRSSDATAPLYPAVPTVPTVPTVVATTTVARPRGRARGTGQGPTGPEAMADIAQRMGWAAKKEGQP